MSASPNSDSASDQPLATILRRPASAAAGQHWLPWARRNLLRNPFGELTRQERSQLAVIDVEAWLPQLTRSHTAIQFVGQCGRGKTTRMLALAERLPESWYVYLPEDQPCPAIAHGNPLLIDEAQRLPRAVRRRIFASGIPLVLATHRDLAGPLRRHGYTVHSETIGEGNTAGHVCRLFNRRIEASRLARGPVPELSIADAQWLVDRFGSDIRAMEGYLYEQLQTQLATDGEVRFSG